MSVEELAEELADFWLSALAETNWEGRLKLLGEIHSQLYADLESQSEYDALSPRFVAAIIERLGSPRVESDAQAEVYGSSFNPQHQEAAKAWRYRAAPGASQGADGPRPSDRRRFPRRVIDAPSQILVQGHAAMCRLVDLSRGGARVTVRASGVSPEPGMKVRLEVPESGLREAIVVFASGVGIGLKFADQSVSY